MQQISVRRRMCKALAATACSALLVAMAACGEGLETSSGSSGDGGGDDSRSAGDGDDGNGATDEWPETILYGVLPTDDTDRLMAIYTPIEEYMTECLDNPFELFTGTDYTAMIEAMRTGNLHVSKFGPFSYTLAKERAGAEALVTPVDESGEPTYQSLIITLESHGFDDLADLEGEPFAFVDATSTSGHLFPRALMLEELGLGNDEIEDWLGDLVFSHGHDASIISVLNGDVAAAAISSNTWVQVERGEFGDHTNIDDLVVLTETQDIPRTVEAIQGDLPDDLKETLTTCFIDALDDPSLNEFFFEDTNIAGGYIPTDDDAYDVVRETAAALGMSPDDLLSD